MRKRKLQFRKYFQSDFYIYPAIYFYYNFDEFEIGFKIFGYTFAILYGF